MLGTAVVTTVEEELDTFASAPVTTGLSRAFVAATALTGLPTVLAVVVVLPPRMATGVRSDRSR